MRLLRQSSMGGGGGGGGGGRGLRRVDSLPRSPLALARSESIKKRDTKKKGSRRARLRAGISAALRELHLGGGRRAGGRGGGGRGDGDGSVPVAAPGVGVVLPRASPDAGTRDEGDRGTVAGSDRRRRSWAVAVAVVLVLACVVALGRGPAICCSTCAAWWCGGRATDPRVPARRPPATGIAACSRRKLVA
ncbi:uncharacterized protein LOC121055996 [Oryza brachyantha]|uniref:uncharacterized protein LOC121055996 n=1 Tax=Oryza brachyantha TaxID=4533 RepID=UPI001ADCECF7|nr:uncharacterized protein LOC121055996 [Oryza brachyantha]